MPVATTFWETFFLLLIFVPLTLIWAFALLDIFRRDDMGGGSKALWVATVFLVPFLGTLVYLIARPEGGTPAERQLMDEAARLDFATTTPAERTEQLKTLAGLHERGVISDDEYAAEKARLEAAPETGASPMPA